MVFFDSNVRIGRRAVGGHGTASSGKELLSAMASLGVGKALVWHVAQIDTTPATGNDLLASCIRGSDELYGCWSIMPRQTDELPHADRFFTSMRENRIFALRAFPARHKYLLNRLTFGDLLDQIVRRRIPLLLTASSESCLSWESLHGLLRELPGLTCVICDCGPWGGDRYFRPLLEEYENVHLESSYLAYLEGSTEDLVRRYGARRIVFGSGFPQRVPQCAMLQLLHADISEDEKEAIAHGNMERLMAEVSL